MKLFLSVSIVEVRKLRANMQECVDCFKIKCRGCGWEPNEKEVHEVQSGILTTCPLCGWKPGR